MRHLEQDLHSALDSLYEGVFSEEAWFDALRMISGLVSGSAAVLFSCDPSSGEVFRADVTGIDNKVMQEYQSRWIHSDPRHAASLTCAVGVPQVDGMLVSISDFHRTTTFNEFFRPADIPFHVATWIDRRPQRGVVLSVQGNWGRGPFTEEERRRIELLVPHLRRVVAMKDRLARAQVHANGLLEMMDRLPFGVLLLGTDLQILEASAAARALLAARAGLHDDNGRLGFVAGADRRAFANWLRENPLRARPQDTLLVARPGGRQPLSLTVLPVAVAPEPWMTPAARWVVLVFDPETALVPTAATLERSLKLSPAEAALAQRLAAGLTLAQAAAELGISLNTARTQLKSIFAKVDVRTQAQLVSKIFCSSRPLV